MKRKDEGEDWIKIRKCLLLQKGKNAKEEIVQVYTQSCCKDT
jgi:hypothetical protein